MNKYCPKCGTAVATDDKFCSKCGFAFQDIDDAVKKSAAGDDAVAKPSSAATINSAAAANGQPTAAVKQQARIEPDKKNTDSKKKHWTRWIVATIVVVVLVVFGYRQFYVPHTVESALDSNGFTSAKGYTTSADLSKHEVVIYLNSAAQQKVAQELAQNEYDTRRVAVENNLSDLAHDLAGKTIGTWKVELALKDSQGASLMWEYSGTKESHRFQTSSAGRQLREEYLNKKAEAAQQAQQEDDEEKFGAGLLGGGIGFLLGGL